MRCQAAAGVVELIVKFEFGEIQSRHPEVAAKAVLEGCTARAAALRGSLRSHLRVTEKGLEMEFGIFSNGFRPHTTAAQTYDEDLAEIVLADQLGFRDVYISEHHGEPIYIDKVDTLPVPELLMCKAAALTKRIRFGAAVKLIHLHHPLDTAIQAAVTDHVIGGGRFIFGYGSGFPSPLFSDERGLSYADRHERLREALELILKCWTAKEPFDWDGKHFRGKGIVATPRPLNAPHMPMATATDTDAMIDLAAARGYTLLTAQLEPAASIRKKADRYARAAKAAGRSTPLNSVTTARYVYLADSRRAAMDDLRPDINYELSYQMQRGLIRVVTSSYGLKLKGDTVSFDELEEAGMYCLGDPDTVIKKLREFYDDTGGFGTLLIVAGKKWATREKVFRSMRLFMEHVAPQLRDLVPLRDPDSAAA
jgi:limonene 1,2-monooxygenase